MPSTHGRHPLAELQAALEENWGYSVSNAHVWRTAQERLQREMTRAQFDTWLRGTHLRAGAEGAVVLCVRTTFAKELLESAFRERIEAAIAAVTGTRSPLQIVVAPSEGTLTAEEQAERAAPRARPQPQGTGGSQRAAMIAPTLFAAANAALPARDAHTPLGVPRRDAGDTGGAAAPPTVVRRRGHMPGPPGAATRSERVREALERVRVPWYAADNQPVGSSAHQGAAEARAVPGASADQWAATLFEGNGADVHVDSLPTHAPAPVPGALGEDMRASRDAEHVLRGTAATEMEAPMTPDDAFDLSGESSATGSDAMQSPIPAPRLNSRYTFDTFIVGGANQLAHAASLAVAEAPGRAYNPLFLYGGVGLGKTHLLHAIGHTAISRALVVLYVSSETFTNEIINAIRYRTTEEFRTKYRSVDFLLVDDIQFIAGKESTEEEFFHTFNSLYETNKQIVICSDRPPKAIISLEERLRSRFEWGLIADIQPPDHEMRVAILRAKADMMHRHVPDDVITFLAGREQSNIRELEGSFNRVLAVSQLQGMPLTIETAKTALASLATDGRQRRVRTDDVLAAVAEFYRIPVDDLQGKQRDKHIVVPRQVAMYLMRQETEASLLEIGQALGGRDHSTVLHGCDKITREINENSALRKEVLAIRQQLLG